MVVFFVGSAIVLTVVGWSLQLRDAFAGKLVGALKTNGELQIDRAVLGGRHDRFSSRVGFTRNDLQRQIGSNTCHLHLR